MDSEQIQLLVPITFSLQEWEEELEGALEVLEEIRSRKLGKVGIPKVKAEIDKAYNRVHYTRDYISRARDAYTKIKEYLEIIKADAEYRSIVLGAWPERKLPGRAALLGGGLLGAGSGAFLFIGIAGAIIFWVIGLILLGMGLWWTDREDKRRSEKYESDFLSESKWKKREREVPNKSN